MEQTFFRSHGERLNDLVPNIHPRKIRTLVFLPDYVNCGRKRAFHKILYPKNWAFQSLQLAYGKQGILYQMQKLCAI